MAINTLIKDTKDRMAKSELSLQNEYARIRTGVANASLLNGIQVEYYGALTELNQLASITVPEARMLLITPYDKSSIGEIDKAIQRSDIGISPTNDGNVIRLVVPALTTERRQELVKTVKKELEDAKVSIRNIRRDAIDVAKKAEKNSEITKDDVHGYEEEIQKVTDASIKNLEKIAADKEKEIMEV